MSVYDSIVTGLEEAVDYEKKKGKARSVKLSISPVADFKAQEIRNLRNELGMTQIMFAGLMGVSTKTVEAWEAGRNRPEGPARRILGILKADPTIPKRLRIVE